MKKLFFLIPILGLIGCLTLANSDTIKLIASRTSGVYHLEACRYARQIITYDTERRQRISENARVNIDAVPRHYKTYNTPEEAILDGKRPCRICKPPIDSKGNKLWHKEKK
ncbi:MAG: hypothetical protein WC312_03770 [Candidatus Omnitrophota bacterium]|jgi:hypothetical protein